MDDKNNKWVFWMQPPYNEKEEHDRINDIPKHLRTILDGTKYPMDRGAVVYNYLKLHPNKFAEDETGVCILNTEKRHDIEEAHTSIFLVTERFQQFCKKENLPLDFFPVLSEGERRYIMMWQTVPVLGEYEVDVEHSQYEKIITHENGISFLKFPLPGRTVFSSSYLDTLSIDAFFTFAARSALYCTMKVQQTIEDAGFEVYWTKFEANETSVDLIDSTRNQQILWLNEARREKYQRTFDYLEQILLAEGDKDVIEKFNVEIKSKWEDQFIRFADGTLPPDERVQVW